MRSRPLAIRVPNALRETLEKRASDLGYPSLAAYFLSLGMYDLLIAKPHTATADICHLPAAEQDKIHDELARMFADGETLKGSWFEARMKEAVQAVAEGRDLPADRVARELMSRIRKRK
jgi:hypothetical protein